MIRSWHFLQTNLFSEATKFHSSDLSTSQKKHRRRLRGVTVSSKGSGLSVTLGGSLGEEGAEIKGGTLPLQSATIPAVTNARRKFLFAFALALPLRAADALRSVFTVEGTSSASELKTADGTWIGQTTQTRYDFVQQSAWTGSNGHILLTEKFVREERSDRELPKGLKTAREKRDGRNPGDAGPVLHP